MRVNSGTSDSLARVGHVVAVGSGKGGVGKSTVSVNLALALARARARVGLIDADIYGPNLPHMLGVTAMPRSAEHHLIPVDVHGVRLMSMQFFLQGDEPVIWRGPMVHGVVRQFLGDVQWGALDYLIVDLPPGTGDVQLTLTQEIPLSGAVIVTTPQDVALLDARKAIAMFHKAGVPILGVIENMAAYRCPHCGQDSEIFGAGGGRRLADELGVPLLGSLPLDPSLARESDAGRPPVLVRPQEPLAAAFESITGAIQERVAEIARNRPYHLPLVDEAGGSEEGTV